MVVDIARRPERFLTHKSITLTLWARNVLALSDGLDPIPLKDFKRFYDLFFEPQETDQHEQAKPRKARTAMKADFLKWLAAKSGLDRVDLSGRLGKTLENLFFEIEEEYGSVSPNDLDLRLIQHFLVC